MSLASSRFNGQKYVGEFKDDLQSGQGTLMWPNGQKYVGEFKNDKPNGQGTLFVSRWGDIRGRNQRWTLQWARYLHFRRGLDSIGRMEERKIREREP